MRIISVQDIPYGDRADTAFKVHEGDQHVLYMQFLLLKRARFEKFFCFERYILSREKYIFNHTIWKRRNNHYEKSDHV